MKYCQGPQCHEYKTKDRIRGCKGDKHYETRKRSSFHYLGGNACSMTCQDDWFRKFGTSMLSITSAEYTSLKELVANGAWYKYRDWRGYNNNTYYFVNDLLGERRPITQEQYQ